MRGVRWAPQRTANRHFFPVVVRGSDLQRRRFSANAQTRDISGSGASLEGINHLVQPGEKIEIEFGTQSAWYSVEWVGKDSTLRAGRVGVRCLEKKYIWNVPAKPLERDIYRQDAARQNQGSAAVHLERDERRMYPRRACRLDVQISTPGSTSHARGTVTDICLNGCYVEMFAPLPVDSVVELDIDLEGKDLRPTGRVRSSQTSFGMGRRVHRSEPRRPREAARIRASRRDRHRSGSRRRSSIAGSHSRSPGGSPRRKQSTCDGPSPSPGQDERNGGRYRHWEGAGGCDPRAFPQGHSLAGRSGRRVRESQSRQALRAPNRSPLALIQQLGFCVPHVPE